MLGQIFDIQRFCLDDGPGIRTTVFLKGCPLHCEWCHNPESLSPKKEIAIRYEKCTGCGACAQVCPVGAQRLLPQRVIERNRCIACGKCVKACPEDALERLGRTVDSADVVKDVLRDIQFFKHGGGVTLSGGEPMLQTAFCMDIADRLHREGVHIAMETCGYAAQENFAAVLPHVQLFLFDYKVDESLYRRYTGVDAAKILGNLRFLHDHGANIILRCPIIPGVNDNENHFLKIAELLASLPHILRTELEPYHSLGVAKAKRIDHASAYHAPYELDREWLRQQAKKLQAATNRPVMIH